MHNRHHQSTTFNGYLVLVWVVPHYFYHIALTRSSSSLNSTFPGRLNQCLTTQTNLGETETEKHTAAVSLAGGYTSINGERVELIRQLSHHLTATLLGGRRSGWRSHQSGLRREIRSASPSTNTLLRMANGAPISSLSELKLKR